MQNLFRGMLFIHLNLNLDIGASRIGLIPSFIGYLLIMRGLRELSGYSPRFSQTLPWAKGMCAFSAVTYVLDLLGITLHLGYVGVLISLALAAASLYISWLIIMGIKGIEAAVSADLGTVPLYRAWCGLAVVSVFLVVVQFVPDFALVVWFAGIVVIIFYLIRFNATKKLYYHYTT